MTVVPALARILGLAGLLPQIAAVGAIASGLPDWRFTALALAFAYAALILSFLGGTWWGIAAHDSVRPPGWVWVAAIAPSLIALAAAVPWAVGGEWPGPSLVLLGVALIGALFVDRRLVLIGLAPAWWMGLRVPLSVGLGSLTIVAAIL